MATYYGFDLFTVWQIRESPTLLRFVVFAAFLMLPVSLLSGVAFTLVAHAVKQELGASMRTTGTAALWNTVGCDRRLARRGVRAAADARHGALVVRLAAVYGGAALLVPCGASARRRRGRALASGALAIAARRARAVSVRSHGALVLQDRRAWTAGRTTLIATREGLTETMRYYRAATPSAQPCSTGW